MSKRLITFGCSYTYGASLPDCLIFGPGLTTPSKLAWPEKLAEKLGIECINKANSGSGNLEILWEILQFKFQAGDIVIPMWSHFSRDHIFTENTPLRINHHPSANEETKEVSKNWLNVHSEYDHNIRNWLYIHHANSFFKSINLEFYHIFYIDFVFDNLEKIPKFLKINNILDASFDSIDYGQDQSHPGIKSHELLSNKMFKLIKEKTLVDI